MLLDKCGKKFERFETISEHETSKAKCPKCGSRDVSQVPGNVFVVTSKKSKSPTFNFVFAGRGRTPMQV